MIDALAVKEQLDQRAFRRSDLVFAAPVSHRSHTEPRLRIDTPMTHKTVLGNGGFSDQWMVLVHGMSQDHRVFSEQLASFGSRYRLLLVDLPGHGLSADSAGPFGHVEFAEHVREILREHDAQGVHYWGTHTGAAVGLFLAVTQPHLIGSLILEGDLIPGRNPPIVAELLGRARATARTKGVDAALLEWWETSCWFDHMRANPTVCRAQEHFEIVASFSGETWLSTSKPAAVPEIESRLAEVACQTLIYNGEFDHSDFLEAAGLLAARLPAAKRLSIADAGGFPAWERPREVNAVVGAFRRTTCVACTATVLLRAAMAPLLAPRPPPACLGAAQGPGRQQRKLRTRTGGWR